MQVSTVNISETVAIVSKYKAACGLSIIYICPWPVVKIKVKMSYNSNVHISQTVTIRTSIVIANTERGMWHFDWHIYI